MYHIGTCRFCGHLPIAPDAILIDGGSVVHRSCVELRNLFSDIYKDDNGTRPDLTEWRIEWMQGYLDDRQGKMIELSPPATPEETAWAMAEFDAIVQGTYDGIEVHTDDRYEILAEDHASMTGWAI